MLSQRVLRAPRAGFNDFSAVPTVWRDGSRLGDFQKILRRYTKPLLYGAATCAAPMQNSADVDSMRKGGRGCGAAAGVLVL